MKTSGQGFVQAKRFELTIASNDPRTACDALALRTGLSKTKVKQAMIKGAVWQQRSGSPARRVRRATAAVRPGERWLVYYDPEILDLAPPPSRCLHDYGRYSIWYKPAGVMSQGSRYGDHCSLTRQIEHHFRSERKVYLVHRLDREASGLLIVAHSRTAAARISTLLRRHKIEKSYFAKVRGNLSCYGGAGRIDLPLDGKSALTFYEVLGYDAAADQSMVRVRIQTGRLHQIRRHLALIGFPVMGDPRYGEGNRNSTGMQLVAYRMSFDCPFGNGRIHAVIDPQEAAVP